MKNIKLFGYPVVPCQDMKSIEDYGITFGPPLIESADGEVQAKWRAMARQWRLNGDWPFSPDSE